jgi:hypothetical protein
MNFSINVGQLIQGAITTTVIAVVVLIASRFVARTVERIEKKPVNGNGKGEDKK